MIMLSSPSYLISLLSSYPLHCRDTLHWAQHGHAIALQRVPAPTQPENCDTLVFFSKTK